MKQIQKSTFKRFLQFCLRVVLRLAGTPTGDVDNSLEVETQTSRHRIRVLKSKRVRKDDVR